MDINSRLIWTLIEIIFNAFEIWLVYKFFINILYKKGDRLIYPIIGAVILFIYVSILNNVNSIDGKLMTILSYCGTLGYAMLAFKRNISAKIFIGILPIVVVIYSDFLTFAIFIMLNIFVPEQAWEPTFERFFMNFIYICITFFLYLMINKFYHDILKFTRHSTSLTVFIAILIVLGILVINFLITITTKVALLEYDIGYLELYIIFIGIVFLVMISSCIYFFNKWSITLMKNQEINMQNQYQKLKEQHYINVQNALGNLEYFRHDVMKHFQIFEILLTTKNTEEALEYLTDIHSQYSQILEISNYTNDKVLNAILSDKKMMAQKLGIEMRISAEKIEKLPLTSYELCSLFDNILENAIEACQHVDTMRFIDVFISFNEGCMRIVVKNNYSGKISFQDGIFLTTKKEKLHHGLGIKIVKDIVFNNGGSINIDYDERKYIFIVTVLIPL